MSKTFIYNSNNQKKVVEIPITTYEEFKSDPTRFYPPWDSEINVSSQTKYTNPYVSQNEVREMTREEQILIDNKTELLQEGEYISKGKIIVVPKPTEIYKPIWNKTSNSWEEGATIEELNDEINRFFNEYISLDEQKYKYEMHKFPTHEIEEKMAENILKRNELIEIRDSL